MEGLPKLHRTPYRLFSSLVLLVVLPLASEAAPLRAGVATVEITPQGEGGFLGGYDTRTWPATGDHVPLFVRALVLECGDRRMALVSLDLI